MRVYRGVYPHLKLENNRCHDEDKNKQIDEALNDFFIAPDKPAIILANPA